MGHAFSIGAGVAWQLKQKKYNLSTVVLDGDGGCLMQLGSLAMISLEKLKKSRLIYVLLDNGIYDSTGAQPTLSHKINFLKLAEGFGFPQSFSITEAEELKKVLNKIKPNMASFIHLKINCQREPGSIRVSDKYNCEQISKRFSSNFPRK